VLDGFLHTLSVTAVIGSMPLSAAQEPWHFDFRSFKVAVFSFCPWILGDQRMRISEVGKISSENSFVGSRAVPYYDAERITCNYNTAIRKGASS
jgi:hypothetical protein